MLQWPPASPCPHRRWLKPCMESKFPLNYVVLLSCCLPSLCDSLHRIGASTTPICPDGLLNHWFLVCWYFAGKENPTSTTKQMLYLKQFTVPQFYSFLFWVNILFLSDYSLFEPQPLDLFSLIIHFGVDGAKKKKANCSYSWRESHQNADHDWWRPFVLVCFCFLPTLHLK